MKKCKASTAEQELLEAVVFVCSSLLKCAKWKYYILYRVSRLPTSLCKTFRHGERTYDCGATNSTVSQRC